MGGKKPDLPAIRKAVKDLIRQNPGKHCLTSVQMELHGTFSALAVLNVMAEGLEEGWLRKEGSKKGTKYWTV